MMPNRFKRGQAVQYEIAGRTGNVTTATGTFKAMGDRGRCIIKRDDGGEASPFVSKVQAIDGNESKPARAAAKPTRRATKMTVSRSTPKARAGRASPKATPKPDRKASPRKASSPTGIQHEIAALHAKLDLILRHLDGASTPATDSADHEEPGHTPVEKQMAA
jgi:hypothetical protein